MHPRWVAVGIAYALASSAAGFGLSLLTRPIVAAVFGLLTSLGAYVLGKLAWSTLERPEGD